MTINAQKRDLEKMVEKLGDIIQLCVKKQELRDKAFELLEEIHSIGNCSLDKLEMIMGIIQE